MAAAACAGGWKWSSSTGVVSARRPAQRPQLGRGRDRGGGAGAAGGALGQDVPHAPGRARPDVLGPVGRGVRAGRAAGRSTGGGGGAVAGGGRGGGGARGG